MFLKHWGVLRAPEAEGGSSAAGGESPGSEKGGESAKAPIKPSHDESTPGDRGEEKKAEKPSRPEWLPENFWNAEKSEANYEELGKSFTETKKKLSMRTDDLTKTLKEDLDKERFAGRPESKDKYELRLPKEIPEDAWEWNEQDPLLGFARDLAFNNGMSQDQFDQLTAAYINSEIAKLPDIEAETKRLGEKGKERIERVDQWLSANVSRGTYAVLSQYATKADMVVAIEELMTKAGAPAYVLDSNAYGSQDILTDAQVRTWMADPKYWDPQQRDAAFVAKVDKAWQKLYPSKK